MKYWPQQEQVYVGVVCDEHNVMIYFVKEYFTSV